MKLKKPDNINKEARYLTHCTNIAFIFGNTNSLVNGKIRVKKYIEITGVELEEDLLGEEYQQTIKTLREPITSEQNLCPQCHAVVEFAQDPMRLCDKCGWFGDYTKLEES